MKKEAANATSDVGTSQLDELYAVLQKQAECGDDCTDTIQKIIDITCENASSVVEPKHHLA